jgi:ABC-2 type transport system permease protein
VTTLLIETVRKELLEMRRQSRLRTLTFVVLGLLASSGLVAYRDYVLMRDERAAAQQTSRAQWVSQGEKNPHTAAHFGLHAYRAPSPLAAFDRGLLSFSGSAVFLEAHKQNLPIHAAALDGTLARRLGEWVPATVLQTLIPLVLLLATFGSIAGERERHALLQLRGLGGSVLRYAWGKVCAAAITLLVLLCPLLLVAIGIIASSPLQVTKDLAMRVAFASLAYGSYFLVFLLLCLAVSSRAHTGRSALIVLLGLWMAWAVVLPRAITSAAGVAEPLPRWSQIEADLLREQGLTSDSDDPYEQRIALLQKATLEKYGAKRADQLPVDMGGVTLLAGEDWGNEAFDRRFGELYGAYRRQEQLIRRSAWFAPVLAVRSISMALSGTDLEHEIAFRQAAESYRRDFVRRMNEAVRDHPSHQHGFKAGGELWSSVPEFVHHDFTLAQVLRSHASDFLILAVWLMIGVAAMVWATRGLDSEPIS